MGDYVWVLCANDFGWIDDGTREMRDGEAAEFQARLEQDLDQRAASSTRPCRARSRSGSPG